MLRTIALLVPLLIVGTAVAGLLLINQMEGGISVRAFEDLILSWGHWGILASIGLMVLHSFVPFPAELVALANGMLYGPLWGTVITWIGAMLGAFLAFGLSRAFGRPFIEAIVARRHWQTLD
ncbi:MAG: TVP38/TMEM64 family protein, partial [bacterium]